ALPHNDSIADSSGVRAVALLANPGDALAAVAMRSMQKQVAGKQVAAWDALAKATGLYHADQSAKPLQDAVSRLSGRPADVRAFVDLLDAGRLYEVLYALPVNEAARSTGAIGRVACEHAKTELVPMLGGWIVGHLVRTG